MIEQKTTNPAMIIGDDKKPIKELREELARTVRTAKELKIPTIILFEGWGASGKGYMIEKLIAELDPRGYKVYSIKEPVGEETRYPMLKRFCRRFRQPEIYQFSTAAGTAKYRSRVSRMS